MKAKAAQSDQGPPESPESKVWGAVGRWVSEHIGHADRQIESVAELDWIGAVQTRRAALERGWPWLDVLKVKDWARDFTYPEIVGVQRFLKEGPADRIERARGLTIDMMPRTLAEDNEHLPHTDERMIRWMAWHLLNAVASVERTRKETPQCPTG